MSTYAEDLLGRVADQPEQEVTFVFFGSESLVGGVKLDSLFQRVNLTPAVAIEAIQGGCAIIPAIAFDALVGDIASRRYEAGLIHHSMREALGGAQ